MQPNLLLILSDNHTRELMGCAGQPVSPTPNLDRLAARGTRFSAASCVSPLCCPSRAAIATGQPPHVTGHWDNALAYDGRTPSWMHLLREAGHQVTCIGKQHFRGGDDYGWTEEVLPMHLLGGKGAVRSLLRGHDAEPAKTGGAFRDLYLAETGAADTDYHAYDRRIAAAAVAWLRQHARRDAKPWCLVVSFISPHPPFQAPRSLLDRFDPMRLPLPPGWAPEDRSPHPADDHLRRIEELPDRPDPAALRRVLAGYLALTAFMDERVGEVLAKADALGLLGETRVVYTSDHGEQAGARGLFGKKILYEPSVGVPLLGTGPGIVAGRVIGTPVSHLDLFPTFLGALCHAIPVGLPGRNLMPAFGGEELAPRPVFAEYHAHGSRAGAYSLRAGNAKLIAHAGGMPDQLFDLTADPGELRDLVDDPPQGALLARLRDALAEIIGSTAADVRAKAAQRARLEELGGVAVAQAAGQIIRTPAPVAP